MAAMQLRHGLPATPGLLLPLAKALPHGKAPVQRSVVESPFPFGPLDKGAGLRLRTSLGGKVADAAAVRDDFVLHEVTEGCDAFRLPQLLGIGEEHRDLARLYIW